MRPIWLGSCDISASKPLPEGRIFRGRILQTSFLSQGKPLQGWLENDAATISSLEGAVEVPTKNDRMSTKRLVIVTVM